MAASRERVPARLLIGLVLAGALALALFAALSPTPAQAGCPICDQYTLDIPDADDAGGGEFSSGGSDPSTDPAPTPSTPAPSTAPTTTVPETTSTTTVVPETDSTSAKKPDSEPAPEPFVPVRVDGPPEQATVLTSTPLHYEGESSASGAALAGLGSPGAIALLAALIAAGAAVAVGRRRSPVT